MREFSIGTRVAARARGLQAQARLVDWATVGVPPSMMGIGPVPGVRKLLARTGLTVADIDYFEVNEAFAVVNLHAERELGLPRERTNLYGGGISIGHPPGATGLRMAYEIYLQLQGRADTRQLRGRSAHGPAIGLTHNLGGIPNRNVASVAIFGLGTT